MPYRLMLRELDLGDRALSLDEQSALKDFNQWVEVAHNTAGAEEAIDTALDALLLLFPQNKALLLRRVDMLMMNPTFRRQDAELLRALNEVLSLPSFLSAPDMSDEQIRMRALRSDVCIKQKKFNLALSD